MAGEAAALCFLARRTVSYHVAMSETERTKQAMRRWEVVFRGRVQGVYFRATTRDVARRFDVAGWVRNEADGSVRMVAEGAEEELQRFVDAVREAKKGHVDDVEVTKAAATGEFTGFEIRR